MFIWWLIKRHGYIKWKECLQCFDINKEVYYYKSTKIFSKYWLQCDLFSNWFKFWTSRFIKSQWKQKIQDGRYTYMYIFFNIFFFFFWILKHKNLLTLTNLILGNFVHGSKSRPYGSNCQNLIKYSTQSSGTVYIMDWNVCIWLKYQNLTRYIICTYVYNIFIYIYMYIICNLSDPEYTWDNIINKSLSLVLFRFGHVLFKSLEFCSAGLARIRQRRLLL